ncbi:MAG: class I mannose-6-phosphate isomerase [Clostridia bacterium]|nr:class I mannose-6-phosphate isomerase [Clostridia bacterium]
MRYPMKLTFSPKYRIWGGDRLAREYGKRSEIDRLGETWELSVRQDTMSLVENGIFAGKTLADVISTVGHDAVSPSYDGTHFPLLIKLIDARDDLSVQVHPDDAYAAARENDLGKTEMWVVLAAGEGAKLVFGLADGVDRTAFEQAVENGRIEDTLAFRPVHAGDVFFIPSGMIHAIGAGIVLAEIQQNSDLTYRVYDYDRRQSDGSLRELHIRQALDVVRPFTDDEVEAIRFEARIDQDGENTLAHCRYFRTERLHVTNRVVLSADAKSFHALLCTEGVGSILFGGEEYPLKKGDCYFIPAKTGEYTLAGTLDVLIASI